MSSYNKAEVSVVLHAAEILQQYKTDQRINVSQFCQDIGISRNNAYKHKRNIDVSIHSLQDKITMLEQQNTELETKLELAEQQAKEADLYKGCRDILVAFNDDRKKNDQEQQLKQESFIEH